MLLRSNASELSMSSFWRPRQITNTSKPGVNGLLLTHKYFKIQSWNTSRSRRSQHSWFICRFRSSECFMGVALSYIQSVFQHSVVSFRSFLWILFDFAGCHQFHLVQAVNMYLVSKKLCTAVVYLGHWQCRFISNWLMQYHVPSVGSKIVDVSLKDITWRISFF